MDGEKQIRLRRAGASHALPQRKEFVSAPGQHDTAAALRYKRPRELRRHRKDNILFIDTVGTDRTGISPTVTGIDDDRRDAPHRRCWFSHRLSRYRFTP
jgi:hypothetical protein